MQTDAVNGKCSANGIYSDCHGKAVGAKCHWSRMLDGLCVDAGLVDDAGRTDCICGLVDKY